MLATICEGKLEDVWLDSRIVDFCMVEGLDYHNGVSALKYLCDYV